MIERVKVKNYKSIADVDVALGKLNVLVGRNGAGKSTFIDVLKFERDSLKVGLETAITEREGIASLGRWTYWGRSPDIEIKLTLLNGGHRGYHSFTLGRTSEDSHTVKHEYGWALGVGITYGDEPPSPGLTKESFQVGVGNIIHKSLRLSSYQPENDPCLAELKDTLIRTCFYTIFPNSLREPQRPYSDTMLLDHGQNLGTALKHIKAQGLWFSDLIAAMHELVGDIVDIRVKAIGGYLVTELRHESVGKRQKWFNLSQESDGTLRMLGLLVALYQDPAPTLIAIEEPELTIHPGALGLLCDILREASERTQILVTTQSPDLISHFAADELRVVERVNGNTEIGMIDETQRAAINSHLFSGGELLRIEGLHRETPATAGAVNA